MGARGNSGVILSQIFRGLAQGPKAATRSAARTCSGLCRVNRGLQGSPTRWRTILTVARDASAAAGRFV
jgi:dihydroxyacetone kinase-like predicted kinase